MFTEHAKDSHIKTRFDAAVKQSLFKTTGNAIGYQPTTQVRAPPTAVRYANTNVNMSTGAPKAAMALKPTSKIRYLNNFDTKNVAQAFDAKVSNHMN
jgi:hypothetical protein